MSFNESDTRAKLIDPALYSRGWDEMLILREQDAGRIDIIDGQGRRRPPCRPVDYLLHVPVPGQGQPVAVAILEAKKESVPAGHGLEQGKLNAQGHKMNVLFVYSSNGHQFVEYDLSTGLTSQAQPLDQFPSPEALRARYEAHMGFRLDSPEAAPLRVRDAAYDQNRRYYQDAAIRATLERLVQARSRGEPGRALLSLATGAGKTFIAVNLLKRLMDAGQLTTALFICDRDELRGQALRAFKKVFGGVVAEASGGYPAKNAKVIVATYQTLGVDSGDGASSYLTQHYPEGFFSHIIIDECHRSAWGKWSQVLTRYHEAAQIGLTATPRQLKDAIDTEAAATDAQITADNVRYFGPPAYEYDMVQAMEDGYLAPCLIRRFQVDVDQKGLTKAEVVAAKPRALLTGERLAPEAIKARYERGDFERSLVLPDRVAQMCRSLFEELIATGGPEQKTIIFCTRDFHADMVASILNNLYRAWCEQQGRPPAEPYAFKCTAANEGGLYLPEFRASSRRRFIATTVDLLSTGVDVPRVRNIVFFRTLLSPIVFYQMVGRGTRIDEETGKLIFQLFDYTGVVDLFGAEFITPDPNRSQSGGGSSGGDGGSGGGGEREVPPIPVAPGVAVQISDQGRFILTEQNGQHVPMPVEQYKAELAQRLLAEAPTLEDFRDRWVSPDERRVLVDLLITSGYSPLAVQRVEGWTECDLFDVLATLGYGMAPMTQADRSAAFEKRESPWLQQQPAPASATLRALVQQFARGGVESLEDEAVWQVPAVERAGGLAALMATGNAKGLINETKRRLFS